MKEGKKEGMQEEMKEKKENSYKKNLWGFYGECIRDFMVNMFQIQWDGDSVMMTRDLIMRVWWLAW